MNSILSDFNKPNYQPTVVAGDIYKDVSFTFIHPATGDVLPATDLDAIKNSVKNIVLTPTGTRPFFPEFGTGVSGLLFETAGSLTSAAIKDEIVAGIRRFEPRISSLKVQIADNHERNAYRITILFTTTYSQTAEFIFLLNRTR